MFARVGFLPRFPCADLTGPGVAVPARSPGAMSDAAFVDAVANYYETDPISRASPTMAECTATYATAAKLAAE